MSLPTRSGSARYQPPRDRSCRPRPGSTPRSTPHAWRCSGRDGRLTIFATCRLRAEDVVALADALGPDSSAVVAPDRRRQGTNALVLRPADALPYAFGPRSFVQHLESARAAGVPVRVHTCVVTSFDLDTPADLDEMHRRRAAPAWLWTTARVGCEHSTCRAELEVVAQEQGG
ncbi:MAG: hypothetical protein WKH64_16410 [Chloroflexia bacterium]